MSFIFCFFFASSWNHWTKSFSTIWWLDLFAVLYEVVKNDCIWIDAYHLQTKNFFLLFECIIMKKRAKVLCIGMHSLYRHEHDVDIVVQNTLESIPVKSFFFSFFKSFYYLICLHPEHHPHLPTLILSRNVEITNLRLNTQTLNFIFFFCSQRNNFSNKNYKIILILINKLIIRLSRVRNKCGKFLSSFIWFLCLHTIPKRKIPNN